MKHRTGLDRSQTLLFPERLEDYIAAENPARFLDAFVGSLDLHALRFTKARFTIKLPPAQPSTCPLAGSFHTASRFVRRRWFSVAEHELRV
jgi:hypothetical protein